MPDLISIITNWWAQYNNDSNHLTAIFTGVLSVVGFLQVLVIIFQASIMLFSLKQTKKSLELTVKSNDITKKTLDINILTNRPIVFPRHVECHPLNDDLGFGVKLENCGNTIALQMKQYINWKVFFEHESPNDYIWADIGTSNIVTSYLGPKTSQYMELMIISRQEIEPVIAGIARLFLWGWVEYSDILEQVGPYRTEFHYEVIITDLGADENGQRKLAFRFPLFGEGNKIT